MIFVTGGTGFIGTHLLQELLLRDEKIRALKRSNSKISLHENLSQRIEWVEGDVLDIPSLEQAMEGCTKVYHCAALLSFIPKEKNIMMRVNAEGTANVVNVALEKKIRKLAYVSSVAAIGAHPADHLINETDPWEPGNGHSNYGITKYLAEREVWRGVAEGLTAVIVNPTLVIGAGNWSDGSPRIFMDTWRGLPAYTLGGSGIVDVRDVVKLLLWLMENPIENERFILNAENWSFKDFFFLLSDLFGRKPPSLNAAPWMLEFIWRMEAVKSRFTGMPPLITKETSRIASRRLYFDNRKIVDATGYTFKPVKTSLEEISQKFLEEIGKKNNRTSTS